MDAEQILEVVHEVGILGVMGLFVFAGGSLMLQYAATADPLGLAAGLVLMITGAVVVARAPARYRKRHAERYAITVRESKKATQTEEALLRP